MACWGVTRAEAAPAGTTTGEGAHIIAEPPIAPTETEADRPSAAIVGKPAALDTFITLLKSPAPPTAAWLRDNVHVATDGAGDA